MKAQMINPTKSLAILLPQMPAPLGRVTPMPIAPRDELMALRLNLVRMIDAAHAEIGALVVKRHAHEEAGGILQDAAGLHIQRIEDARAELVSKTVARRLSLVSDCRFQMMVDGVPYYFFTDAGTGTRVDGLAYGTEANRVLYQLKADLEKSVRRETMRELGWIDEALANWRRHAVKCEAV